MSTTSLFTHTGTIPQRCAGDTLRGGSPRLTAPALHATERGIRPAPAERPGPRFDPLRHATAEARQMPEPNEVVRALGGVQASLWGSDQPRVTAAPRPERVWLDDDCWVDHQPRWLPGADTLLQMIIDQLPLGTFTRPMYDRLVLVPRLSWFGMVDDDGVPDTAGQIAAALDSHYSDRFTALGVNLYRDGSDSVAWHADRIGRACRNPLVALVSLGAPRPFLLRPMHGGPSTRFTLGDGDLLVMGGAVQHRWEHCVPKVRRAAPRMSLGFRNPQGLPGR